MAKNKKLGFKKPEDSVTDEQIVPAELPKTVDELNGYKVGTQYWFQYRDNDNCFGRLTTIFPGNDRIPPSVTIFEEMTYQHYVCVPLSVLRNEQIGTKVKRRIVRHKDPKPPKKKNGR